MDERLSDLLSCHQFYLFVQGVGIELLDRQAEFVLLDDGVCWPIFTNENDARLFKGQLEGESVGAISTEDPDSLTVYLEDGKVDNGVQSVAVNPGTPRPAVDVFPIDDVLQVLRERGSLERRQQIRDT